MRSKIQALVGSAQISPPVRRIMGIGSLGVETGQDWGMGSLGGTPFKMFFFSQHRSIWLIWLISPINMGFQQQHMMWDFAKQHEDKHHIYKFGRWGHDNDSHLQIAFAAWYFVKSLWELWIAPPFSESQVWHMQRGILKGEEDNRAVNSASGRLVALETG